MKRYITMIILALSVLSSCRKEIVPEPCTDPLNPNCINYHPCNGVQPVTADFEMWYMLPDYASDYQTKKKLLVDSVFTSGEIYFKAVLNNATYQWKFNNSTSTETRKKFEKRFYTKYNPNNTQPDTSIYGEYSCTLTVKKDANKSCYPNDVSTATITRNFIIKRPSQLLTSGKFKVLFDGYADSNTIVILPWTHVNKNDAVEFDDESSAFRVFVGFKETIKDSIVVPTYFYNNFFMDKFIYLDKKEEFPHIPYNGVFNVNPQTHDIEGGYFIKNRDGIIKQHHFKGRKL